MRLVIIESPYAGDIERNLAYADLCIRDCILRSESPYASHALLTRALRDSYPRERDLGIRAGYAWWKAADLVAFYMDLGMSPGMHKALQRAKTMQKKVEQRWLGKAVMDRLPVNEAGNIPTELWEKLRKIILQNDCIRMIDWDQVEEDLKKYENNPDRQA